jgi:hypothetical protein
LLQGHPNWFLAARTDDSYGSVQFFCELLAAARAAHATLIRL